MVTPARVPAMGMVAIHETKQSARHVRQASSHKRRLTHQKTDSVEVDSLQAAVAKTDTDGGTGDAHGGGDGEGVLGEDKDGDGGTHLHGATATWAVVGDLVAHDCLVSNDSTWIQ